MSPRLQHLVRRIKETSLSQQIDDSGDNMSQHGKSEMIPNSTQIEETPMQDDDENNDENGHENGDENGNENWDENDDENWDENDDENENENEDENVYENGDENDDDNDEENKLQIDGKFSAFCFFISHFFFEQILFFF